MENDYIIIKKSWNKFALQQKNRDTLSRFCTFV